MIGTNLLVYLSSKNRKSILSILERILKTEKQSIDSSFKSSFIIKTANNSEFRITLKAIHTNQLKSSLINIKLFVSPIIQPNKILTLSYQNITDLSHELRTPLFSIRSLLETLYEYEAQLNSDQRLEFLEIATNETNRLNNLVRDILDLAELENKKNSIKTIIDLDQILKEIIQINNLIAINKRLLISKTTENINGNIHFDYYFSIKILSNLLNNCVKFTYPKGLITIQIKTVHCNLLENKNSTSFLRISVIDTGIGISIKDKKNIFNRFCRGRTKTNTIIGSGLGLPIIKETLGKENQELNLATRPQKGTSASFNLTKL